MQKSILSKLFRVGSIPRKLRPILEGEGIVLADEGMGGWFIARNVKGLGSDMCTAERVFQVVNGGIYRYLADKTDELARGRGSSTIKFWVGSAHSLALKSSVILDPFIRLDQYFHGFSFCARRI